MNYQIFQTPEQVVTALAEDMLALSEQERETHISLSGGRSPKLLFRTLAQAPYKQKINWANLHFWWGDERCVEPTDAESNFGEANELLFKHIDIPQKNIHRILGENSPEPEAKRFADEMQQLIPAENGLPAFDWIMLGMGTDGHTASLFPNQTNYDEPAIALVAAHPESGQLRVSKSARLLQNAKRITYLVLGDSKAEVLKQIQQQPAEQLPYPAAKIKSLHGQTEWFVDAQAASLLVKGEK
ncbi:6-phosphogluconolactonase [Vibrio sp. SCSIO 43137]|uniref:6-phosphogluconolactonase n=1 Tax=Vibrio sp. SCSIO 43137 TaxID=3021011 RepID=UPI002306E950|nr:6-phosphogluconolactonase [Vibrio sp. SCSIO 43137]WCE32241.1 6-phosphogluconolactonase [Vibrio sp. SCSIO 43137]